METPVASQPRCHHNAMIGAIVALDLLLVYIRNIISPHSSATWFGSSRVALGHQGFCGNNTLSKYLHYARCLGQRIGRANCCIHIVLILYLKTPPVKFPLRDSPWAVTTILSIGQIHEISWPFLRLRDILKSVSTVLFPSVVSNQPTVVIHHHVSIG